MFDCLSVRILLSFRVLLQNFSVWQDFVGMLVLICGWLSVLYSTITFFSQLTVIIYIYICSSHYSHVYVQFLASRACWSCWIAE